MAEMTKKYRLNKSNGVTYIYLDRPYWDKDKKSPRHESKCIGKLGPDGEEIYNAYYKSMQEAEKEAEQPISVSKVERLGDRLIADKFIKETGLRKVMVKSFGKEIADKYLALATYEMCTGRSFTYADDWAEERGYDLDLSSQRISDLFKTTTQEGIDKFLKNWIEHNTKERSVLFDITSVSSYGKDNRFVERGYNRDGEKLEQINMALLASYSSTIPLWYSILAGSISDVTVLNTVNETLGKLVSDRFTITGDRGFYSESNMQFLVEKGYKFMIPVPNSVGWAKKLLAEKIPDIRLEGTVVTTDDENEMVYCTSVFERSSVWGRVWKHIYFDAGRKEVEIMKFNKRIAKLKPLVENDEIPEKDKDFCGEYFIVKENPKHGRKVELNMEKAREFHDSCSCSWVILTNSEKDPEEALKFYRQRNDIELHFDDLKNRLDCKRLRTHSEQTMNGKVFTCFLSLILINALKNAVQAIPGKERKWWTWDEFLWKADSYSKTSFTGKYKPVYKVPTAGQRMIFKHLGIPYYWKGKLVKKGEDVVEEKQPKMTD